MAHTYYVLLESSSSPDFGKLGKDSTIQLNLIETQKL